MSERQCVTAGMFILTLILLAMAYRQPTLWNIDLFKIILQAVVLTGLLSNILAFYYSATKSDDAKTVNTGKAFDAITAISAASTVTPVKDEMAQQ